jgi:hypothetical protein
MHVGSDPGLRSIRFCTVAVGACLIISLEIHEKLSLVQVLLHIYGIHKYTSVGWLAFSVAPMIWQ